MDVNAVFCLSLVLILAKNSQAGDEDCEDCNAATDNFLEIYSYGIQSLMPYVVNLQDSVCSQCNFSNMNQMKRIGDVCIRDVPGGHRQTLHLQLDTINTRCLCTMETSDGKKLETIIDGDWDKGRMQVTVEFVNDQCKVIEGSVDCDNPDPKQCKIDVNALVIRCESENAETKEECEKQKQSIVETVVQSLAEKYFPLLANEEIGKRAKLVELINCKFDID